MNGKHLFLTSAGLTDKMKEKFFDIIGKCPKDVNGLSTLFQTNFFRLFFRYCTGV